MKFGRFYISLQKVITLFVCTVVILSLTVTGILIGEEVTDETKKYLSDKAINIARTVARSPLVIEALEHKQDEKNIQSYAEEVRKITDVRFIVVMDMNHIRKSHPDKEKIGKRFIGGDEARAMKGKSYTSVAEGTLGTSFRAFVPVKNREGQQVGVVAVGIMMNRVEEAIINSTHIIYVAIGVGLIIGILGAWILARKIKGILFGLEPFQIANLLQERNAMLESVREGIVAVDRESRIVLANSEAVRLFHRAGMNHQPIGENIEDYLPQSRLRHVVEGETPEFDREVTLNGLTLLVNRVPVKVDGHTVAALATFRDKTEIKKLAEQLTGVKMYAEALRVKTHEFMNKLHVILGLVQMRELDRLSSYIQQLTDHYHMEAGSVSQLVREPILAGFLLSKLSYARERGVQLNLSGNGVWPRPEDPGIVDEWVTIFGNLIDNAMEAVEDCEQKEIDVSLETTDSTLSLSVTDTGKGISDDQKEKIFEKGFSTKGENRGYGLNLVRISVEKLGGTLTHIPIDSGTKILVTLPFEEKDENP
ncbi:DcuS/MalK family sensor histidine kinase [Paludifilum halophilum]|uniref:histidine kinase n=1 Tax=Paludifilum halophilum TaxID=1642702 RepID=A0A235B4V6_9BACL|nr:DcuS/MalK family sensor histidine kinase [Paludifilum halophilum]OYD07340.1 two-component system sensor histidine kinase DcuS [Paludifilum halophilum]